MGFWPKLHLPIFCRITAWKQVREFLPQSRWCGNSSWHDNNKKLIDKRWAFYLGIKTEKSYVSSFHHWSPKTNIDWHLAVCFIPWLHHQSFGATASLRMDKQYFKASEISFPFCRAGLWKRLGLVEYVLSFQCLNILHGARMKFYAEAMNQFNFEPCNNFHIDLNQVSPLFLEAWMGIPINRVLNHSIVCDSPLPHRWAANPNIYYLGSVQPTTLFPSFDNSIPLPPGSGFCFQNQCTHT